MISALLFRSIGGALLKPLLVVILIPLLMGGMRSCAGGKAELRRAMAAHRQTAARIGTLGEESERLRQAAEKQRQRADANRRWAQQAERQGTEEIEICPASCLLPQ